MLHINGFCYCNICNVKGEENGKIQTPKMRYNLQLLRFYDRNEDILYGPIINCFR